MGNANSTEDGREAYLDLVGMTEGIRQLRDFSMNLPPIFISLDG